MILKTDKECLGKIEFVIQIRSYYSFKNSIWLKGSQTMGSII